MRFLLYFVITVFTMMLFSCNITKHIGEEEQLLIKNKLEFNKKHPVKNANILKAELETLYRQKPNEKWLFFYKFPAYLHIKIENYKQESSLTYSENNPSGNVELQEVDDLSPNNFEKEIVKDSLLETSMERAIRNLAERRIAEPPTIFSEEQMEITRKQMENYMHNRGYFDAIVEASVYLPKEKNFNPFRRKKRDVISKKAKVTYFIDTKPLYVTDTVTFLSKDTAIQEILNELKSRSYFRKGSPVDGVLYDKEKTRITNTLRNRGYAFFTSNYIAPLEGDTTGYQTNIVLNVLPPNNGGAHEKFKVGKIYIYPNYNPIIDRELLIDSLIDGYHFLKEKGTKFWIKPNRLSENIFLKSGNVYRQIDLNRTNRKLTDLGAFRFVNFRQEIDKIEPDKINFYIQITPRKKREIGYDLEPNFSQRNNSNNSLNLLGTSVNGYLGNKNLFRGAEQFSTNIFGGLEFDLDDNLSLNVIDLKIQFNLDIPRFTDYLGIYKGLNRLNILKDNSYLSINDLAKTRVKLGYNFLSLAQFYTYHLFDAGWGFDYKKGRNRFIFNNLAIDLLRPVNIEPIFQGILDANLFLSNSFGDQLFTGFLMRDFKYIWNKGPNSFGESYFMSFYADVSGGEIFGINELYNELAGNNRVLKLGTDFEFSQYAKFEFEARYTRKFNSKISAASRINIGIANPFGNSKEVPYVKQFYVGGPQSIRAWGARGLGPGSYLDPLTQTTNNRLLFYQTGDFKFEINGEFRFFLTQLFGRVEGAVFLDIGNVWTLNSDGNNGRPGSVLQWRPIIDTNGDEIGDNFFKEMAIGTGFGIRYDFDYFLLRFDLGYPIKNPYKTLLDNGKNTYLAFPTLDNFSQGINYNLGMNYPF